MNGKYHWLYAVLIFIFLIGVIWKLDSRAIENIIVHLSFGAIGYFIPRKLAK